MPYGALPVTGARIVDGTITIDDIAQTLWGSVPEDTVGGSALVDCSIDAGKLSFSPLTDSIFAAPHSWQGLQDFCAGINVQGQPAVFQDCVVQIQSGLTVGEAEGETTLSQFLCHRTICFQASGCSLAAFNVDGWPTGMFCIDLEQHFFGCEGCFVVATAADGYGIVLSYCEESCCAFLNLCVWNSLDVFNIGAPTHVTLGDGEYAHSVTGNLVWCSCDGCPMVYDGGSWRMVSLY